MTSEHIFALALGLQNPWELLSVKFEKLSDDKNKELHIEIGFKRGSKFLDKNNNLCSVHDTKNKIWRHLNFFEHKCYIHCDVPRIKTSDGKVLLIDTPWSRSNSGFTLLFEAYLMARIEAETPINKIADLIKENACRLWVIFNHWVANGLAKTKIDKLADLGVDETSRKKGHSYVTIGVDLDTHKVIKVTEGKGKNTLKAIKEHIENKGISAKAIKNISMDLSPSFISGARENFPEAEIHFDRFHVIKLLNEAMDEVRKQERKEHEGLKGHKYTFLKNKNKLSKTKHDELCNLIILYPTLGKAYRLKELFNDLWLFKDAEEAGVFLKSWCEEVEEEKILPFMNFVKTLRAHWSGIINYCTSQINNGILESINSKIQLAKKRARGYRNINNLINMIYFLCGGLAFDYPLISS